jgi:RHS repeat-associated protein
MEGALQALVRANAFGFTYNPDGQPLTLTRPNGVTGTTAYDAVGRPSTITYKNGTGNAYTYDASGNRTSASDASGTESYSFDTVGRLTGVSYPDGTSLAFGYDAAGNRTSMTAGASTTNYTYDAASELTSAGSTSYTYDPAGNRVSEGSASFTYDDFGYLATATSGAASIAYQTNGDGLRVIATTAGNTSTYTWDQAAALPELLSDGTTGYLSAGATVLAETGASSTSYTLTDALGSVRSLTDASGSTTASSSYDVFGSTRSSSGSIGSLGYTGALSDASGLTYLQARSLDPSTGTMLSRDPMTPGGPGVTGYNPYPYASQNPVTYTDPSGRDAGLAGLAVNLKTVAIRTIPTMSAFGLAVAVWLTLDGILLGCVLTRSCDVAFPPVAWRPGVPNIPLPNLGLPDLGQLMADLKQLAKAGLGALTGAIAALLAKGLRVMVADSNVFMDIMEPAAEIARDALLVDPRNILLAPFSAISEVFPIPTQLARLARAIPIPDAPLSATQLASLTTGLFNDNDARIVETACVLHVPVATANIRMVAQVRDYPPRAARWSSCISFVTLP